MPVHDWTLVDAGIFHAFHHGWVCAASRVLNTGLLHSDYYALMERAADKPRPDFVLLERPEAGPICPLRDDAPARGARARIRLSEEPPNVRFTATTELDAYARKCDRIAVRDSDDHQLVAVVEIVSPAVKACRRSLRRFIDRGADLLDAGVHLLVVDIIPPGPRDPQGIHAAIWSELTDDRFELLPGEPLTLVAYSAGDVKTAYIEPVAVGDVLPDMPLFLTPWSYVPFPLEETYRAAWAGMPRHWRDVLEPPTS